MTNTEIPKEKSQSALYFKLRAQLGKFTTPLDESNPAGTWRDWTFDGKTGKTYELQTDKIQGDLIDARINTQEFEDKDGKKRKETSLLLCLEEAGQSRVLKLPVKGTYGLSKPFRYFAQRCETIQETKWCSFELWTPPGADAAVMLYKQDDGEKWPNTRKSNYPWNEANKDFDGLPPLIITKDALGEEQKDSKDRDEYLTKLVVAFCERIQNHQSNKPEPTPAEVGASVEEDEDVPMF